MLYYLLLKKTSKIIWAFKTFCDFTRKKPKKKKKQWNNKKMKLFRKLTLKLVWIIIERVWCTFWCLKYELSVNRMKGDRIVAEMSVQQHQPNKTLFEKIRVNRIKCHNIQFPLWKYTNTCGLFLVSFYPQLGSRDQKSVRVVHVCDTNWKSLETREQVNGFFILPRLRWWHRKIPQQQRFYMEIIEMYLLRVYWYGGSASRSLVASLSLMQLFILTAFLLLFVSRPTWNTRLYGSVQFDTMHNMTSFHN